MTTPNFKRNTWANLAKAQEQQVSRFSSKETREMNRQSLAVTPRADEFDESGSAFFASEGGGLSTLSESEVESLDTLIENHGLANVLKALKGLLESRVEEGAMSGSGELLLHLSRDDAFARAAEHLSRLVFHPDIAEL